MKRILVALVFFPIASFSQTGLTSQKAVVVSARAEASQIGADIMKQGGNAFDAAIAVQLALAVAYPYAGNISGGGFMVYRTADGKKGTLDFREIAPAAASKDIFLDKNGNVITGKSTESGAAVGIPGSVAGIYAIHERFGSLPMAKLFAPAIALAEKGVTVSSNQLKQLDEYQKDIVRLNGDKTLFAKKLQLGDVIKYPALAKTLKRIAKHGKKEFYEGQTAQKFVSFVNKHGGVMAEKDFAEYEAKWRDPIEFDYKNIHVVTMAPPSSGGFCLEQLFGMLEDYDVKKLGHNSVGYMQLLTEAERRSFADRNHFLGDPDFVKIPLKQLVDKAYLKKRMASFTFEKATKSSDVDHGDVAVYESRETTHFSIVDTNGNAVAITTTLNGAFGSKLYCDELGFFLNNEMDDFSAKPGAPNFFGLTGSEANSIAPKKRMLSSMTPTIVEKDGKLFMVLGTPGGSTIITSVLQTILNVSEFGMTMQQAVDAPRFHHQWLPDAIIAEPDSFAPETLKLLEKKGYVIDEKIWPILGAVDAILVRPDGLLEGGADHRSEDSSAGF